MDCSEPYRRATPGWSRRLTFRMDAAEREVYDVDLEDYH